jgi:hypothetical protein
MGPVIPLHLGALHPVEQIATIVLAFGPFLVLGIVIAVRRRAEAGEDLDEAAEHEPRQSD